MKIKNLLVKVNQFVSEAKKLKDKIAVEQNKKNYWRRKHEQRLERSQKRLPSKKTHEPAEKPVKVEIKSGGTFSSEVRLLVLKLISLEIPSSSVSPCIQAVAQHIFNSTISTNDLPSRQTILNITDEGQALVKYMYADKLSTANHYFGLVGWLSGGFTPCRHLRPSSGREHTIVTYSVR